MSNGNPFDVDSDLSETIRRFAVDLAFWMGNVNPYHLKRLCKIWSNSKSLREWLNQHVNRPSYELYYGRRMTEPMPEMGDRLDRKERCQQWSTRKATASWFTGGSGVVVQASVSRSEVIVDIDRFSLVCGQHRAGFAAVMAPGESGSSATDIFNGDDYEGEVLTVPVSGRVVEVLVSESTAPRKSLVEHVDAVLAESEDKLEEATRFKKEKGVDPERGLEKLAKWVDKKNVYLHFSKLNKVGINPKQSYLTPMGIYTYPFDRKWFDILRKGEIPFAGQLEFIHLIQLTNDQKFIKAQPSGRTNYSKSQYKKDVEKLRKKYDGTFNIRWGGVTNWDDLVELTKEKSIVKSPFGFIFALTRSLAFQIESSDRAAITTWSKMLREDIGIDGIIDQGSGVVHKNEPEQTLILNPRAFKRVLTVTQDELRRSTSIAVSGSPEYQSLERRISKFLDDASKLKLETWQIPFMNGADMAKMAKTYQGLLSNWQKIWKDVEQLASFERKDKFGVAVKGAPDSPQKRIYSLYKRLAKTANLPPGISANMEYNEDYLKSALRGFQEFPKWEKEIDNIAQAGDIESLVSFYQNKPAPTGDSGFGDRAMEKMRKSLGDATDFAFGDHFLNASPEEVTDRIKTFMDTMKAWGWPSLTKRVEDDINAFMDRYERKQSMTG